MTFLRITNIAQNYQEQSLGNSEQSLGNSERKVSLDKNGRIGALTRVPPSYGCCARRGGGAQGGARARGAERHGKGGQGGHPDGGGEALLLNLPAAALLGTLFAFDPPLLPRLCLCRTMTTSSLRQRRMPIHPSERCIALT